MTDIDMERLEYFRDRYHALVVIDYKVADDNHTGSLLSLDDVIKRLNKVTVENEQLKKEKDDIKSKAEKFVELYEIDFGKNYYTPPRSGKTVRLQLWIVRKILDEIGVLEW